MSDAAIFRARRGAAGQKVESCCRGCGEWLPDPEAAWRCVAFFIGHGIKGKVVRDEG